MLASFLQKILHNINVWHIRMVALTLIVIFVGVGSQTLVNTFAATTVQPAVNASLAVQSQSEVLPATHCVIHGQKLSGGHFHDTAHPHFIFTAHC